MNYKMVVIILLILKILSLIAQGKTHPWETLGQVTALLLLAAILFYAISFLPKKKLA